MRAKSFTLGLSLAAAGVVTPIAAFAQAPAPATPPAAPAAPAPAAPAAPAPAAAAPAPAEPAAAAPAPAPAEPPAAAAPEAAPPAAAAPAAPEAATPAAAEPAKDAPPPLATITGYVDAAYHANLSKYSFDSTVPLRGYDSNGGNSFLLHAAHLGVAHSFGPEASAFISLDFGNDARFNNFNYAPPTVAFNPGNPNATPPVPPSATVTAVPSSLPVDVREAYAQWTPGDFLLKGGKFVTLNGIEVVDGPLNPTITRGFLFVLAEPVTHTGVKAQYTLGGGMAHIGAGIVNGWDNLFDTNNKKTILFNADVAPSSMFHAQISGSWGAEQPNIDDNPRTTVDLTGAFVLDSLTLNFQGLYGAEGKIGVPDATGAAQDDSWFGFGLQPVYTMDMFSLGGRLEYFADKHGSRALTGPTGAAAVDDISLFNFTITPGITPTKNFTLRAEYRIDAILGAKTVDPANAAAGFQTNKDLLNGKSSQHTVAIGATYSF